MKSGDLSNGHYYLLLPDGKYANIEKLLIQYARLIKKFLPDSTQIDPDAILMKTFRTNFSSKMYFIKNYDSALVLKLILSVDLLTIDSSVVEIYNSKNVEFEDYYKSELTFEEVNTFVTELIKYNGLQIIDELNSYNQTFDEYLQDFKLEISIIYDAAMKCLKGDTFNLSFKMNDGKSRELENVSCQNFICLFKLYSANIDSNTDFYFDFNLLLYEQLQYHFQQVIARINTDELDESDEPNEPDEPVESVEPETQYDYLYQDTVLLDLGIGCISFGFQNINQKPMYLIITFDANECIIGMKNINGDDNAHKLIKIEYESNKEKNYHIMSDINGGLFFNIMVDDISKSTYSLWDDGNSCAQNQNEQNPSTITLYFDPITNGGYKFKITYEDLIKMILESFKQISSTNTSISKNLTYTKNINIRKLKAICNKLNIHYNSNINKTLNMILQKINEINN